MIVTSKRTGKVLGKVTHTHNDDYTADKWAYVKGVDGRSYRYNVKDLKPA
jgi:hypothetical protein